MEHIARVRGTIILAEHTTARLRGYVVSARKGARSPYCVLDNKASLKVTVAAVSKVVGRWHF